MHVVLKKIGTRDMMPNLFSMLDQQPYEMLYVVKNMLQFSRVGWKLLFSIVTQPHILSYLSSYIYISIQYVAYVFISITVYLFVS